MTTFRLWVYDMLYPTKHTKIKGIDQSNINHTDQQLQKRFVVFEAAVCILLRFHVNGQRHQWCIDQLKNVVENTSLLQILGSNCLL